MLVQILDHIRFVLKNSWMLLFMQTDGDLVNLNAPSPSMAVLNDHPIITMILTEFQHVNAVWHHQRSNICFIVVIMY